MRKTPNAILLFTFTLIVACGKDNPTEPNPGSSALAGHLTLYDDVQLANLDTLQGIYEDENLGLRIYFYGEHDATGTPVRPTQAVVEYDAAPGRWLYATFDSLNQVVRLSGADVLGFDSVFFALNYVEDQVVVSRGVTDWVDSTAMTDLVFLHQAGENLVVDSALVVYKTHSGDNYSIEQRGTRGGADFVEAIVGVIFSTVATGVAAGFVAVSLGVTTSTAVVIGAAVGLGYVASIASASTDHTQGPLPPSSPLSAPQASPSHSLTPGYTLYFGSLSESAHHSYEYPDSFSYDRAFTDISVSVKLPSLGSSVFPNATASTNLREDTTGIPPYLPYPGGRMSFACPSWNVLIDGSNIQLNYSSVDVGSTAYWLVYNGTLTASGMTGPMQFVRAAGAPEYQFFVYSTVTLFKL